MGPSSYSTRVLDVSVDTKFVRIVHIVYAAKMFILLLNSTLFYEYVTLFILILLNYFYVQL